MISTRIENLNVHKKDPWSGILQGSSSFDLAVTGQLRFHSKNEQCNDSLKGLGRSTGSIVSVEWAQAEAVTFHWPVERCGGAFRFRFKQKRKNLARPLSSCIDRCKNFVTPFLMPCFSVYHRIRGLRHFVSTSRWLQSHVVSHQHPEPQPRYDGELSIEKRIVKVAEPPFYNDGQNELFVSLTSVVIIQ